MILQQIFIANLKKYRKLRGISQMTLSGLCNMAGNYIGQIEMGRRIPSFDKIEKIAKVLKIPPGWLFMDEGAEATDEENKTKDYLEKMPAHVKKEIITRLLLSIKADVTASLDSGKY